jgi:hypothetical protein
MTDTQLIDWLEGHPVTIRREWDGLFIVHGFSSIGRGMNLRAALAAIVENAKACRTAGIPSVREGKGPSHEFRADRVRPIVPDDEGP